MKMDSNIRKECKDLCAYIIRNWNKFNEFIKSLNISINAEDDRKMFEKTDVTFSYWMGIKSTPSSEKGVNWKGIYIHLQKMNVELLEMYKQYGFTPDHILGV